mmetsp:Transcript_5253/g.15212  ORF Transcript_5253/g.15212 Transcript_5253/m.15212 type:complete len:84 (+) Transcript_5253:1091-1342(+)
MPLREPGARRRLFRPKEEGAAKPHAVPTTTVRKTSAAVATAADPWEENTAGNDDAIFAMVAAALAIRRRLTFAQCQDDHRLFT